MSGDVLQNRPILVASQVTRRFGGLLAVNKVDFTIPERSIVSLIGPNGAGKTTFFNVLLGVIDPTSGEVQFQGRRMIARPERIAFESVVWVLPALLVGLLGFLLAEADILSGRLLALVGFIALLLLVGTLLLGIIRPVWYQKQLERLGIFRSARPNDMVEAGVGRTFQNIRLFQNMTAVENVLIGMHTKVRGNLPEALFNTPRVKAEEKAAEQRAEDLLALVGLKNIGNETARNLPYGDQRRLEIARALAADPKLLLLDEPAAGMNPKETQDLVSLISKLRNELGLTILLIEHDMKLVMGISDRITVLDHGEKIAEGSPEEVRRDPRVIEAYLGSASRMTAETLPAPAATDVILRLHDVHTYYGAIHALRGINVEVNRGEIVTLIGANGAGKTTTLRTISGLLHPRQGAVELNGADISKVDAHELVTRGIGHAPEGRRIFSRLTVYENLLMGGFTRSKAENVDQVAHVYELFPRLKERHAQKGGTLSGGEQQMLAIGRALMTRPSVLLLDEPSLGLAPILVQQIFKIIREINERGMTILLVEQNALQALSIANRGYVLQTGEVVLSGSSGELMVNETVRKAYLGED